MTERPILFSGPMVRALLDGSKTQTRRVVKPQPIADARFVGGYYVPGTKRTEGSNIAVGAPYVHNACAHGQPGDRLWVRETWMDLQGTGIEIVTGSRERYAYGADTPRGSYGDDQRKCYGLKWRPSIHMPRAVSRITLEITSVRVERLQDISEADARAEGALGYEEGVDAPPSDPSDEWSYRASFQRLWAGINGPDSWAANPWVWVVEFRRLP